ncbi:MULTISPECIES: hypothetical protein [Flavobacterium]|uniref:LysM domain-containing protein n=1 Tax=Flavobacterium jumunjinense TaxID=998845 RepID=A0ABV5GIQ7_9FLAO|nr:MULTISPECIES: hypothetical protein [Flavobacterium]
MKPKYKKYKIKRGDTLEGISLQLEKSTHEVKSFHNVFCNDTDYIGNELPCHLKELFIYPEYNQEELSLIPKVSFSEPYKLELKPSQNKINYGVMYTITTGEDSNTLKYEISLVFKGKNSDNDFIFEIDRISKTYINDEEASSIADELAEKTNTVLYPLEIIVSQQGRWTGINNYAVIKTRWETVKEKILDEYEGRWVKQYLASNEVVLEEENLLFRALMKDWFLNSYFNSIYIYYTHKFKLDTTVSFPILTNCKAVEYKIEQKINEYLDEYNLIRIEQNGILEDERSKSDLQNEMDIPYYGTLYPEYDKANGKFRSLYFLNGKSNLIESLYLESSIALNVEKKIQVVVSIL